MVAKVSPSRGPGPTAEEIVIPASDVRLAGTLWMPADGGAAHVVVMVHGSGEMTRDNDVYFPPIREELLRAGISVLGYDKRGVGDSTGDWITANLRDLAADAVAAVAFLRSQPDTADASIGLFGHSQGGWITPIAATMSRDVDWVVTNSGPGVSLWDQVLFDFDRHLRDAGVSEDNRARSMAAMGDLHAAVRTHAPLERCIELLGVVQALPEGSYLPIHEAPTHFTQDRDWWLLYDPRPVLERVRCPVLALFGELDRVVPVPDSVEIFEASAARAKNEHVTVRVFPGADHRILIGDDFAHGYFETLTGWIRQQRSARSR